MRLFIKEILASNVIKTAFTAPSSYNKDLPTNHNKFMIITDSLVDGTLTDLLLTGTSNLTWGQMAHQVNETVILNNKNMVKDYIAYHNYIWHCSSADKLVFYQSITTMPLVFAAL